VHLTQPAGVADEDQRRRCEDRRPQDDRDLAEGELTFQNAVAEGLLGDELHGRAFRECS
jgi:hypothetical protein